MTANVLRKLFHRRIASLRLLPQSHEHDIVEVAFQPPLQLRGRTLTRAADQLRADLFQPISGANRVRLEHSRTWPPWIGVAHRSRQFVCAASVSRIRRP